MQVLACDPEDAIIAEPSSTKAGVAVTVELGASSSSLDVYHPPKVKERVYRVILAPRTTNGVSG